MPNLWTGPSNNEQNENAELSVAEQLAELKVDITSPKVLRLLDEDKDWEITKSELSKLKAHFEKYDLDKDGEISEGEWDLNDDGIIYWYKEWKINRKLRIEKRNQKTEERNQKTEETRERIEKIKAETKEMIKKLKKEIENKR